MPNRKQHIKSPPSKSNEKLSELMQVVLDLARKEGATEAAVGVSHDEGFSIDVRMCEVETVAFNEDKGINLTVYIDKRKGSASSTDTSPEACLDMVKKACTIAKASAADPCFGLADTELMAKEILDLDLYHPWTITPEEAIKEAIACETYALSLDKRISNSDGVNISTGSGYFGYANSKGVMGVLQSSRHALSCSVIAQDGEAMQRDYEYSTNRNPALLMSKEQVAKTAVERAVARLGGKKIKTQKAPILFSSRISSGLFASFIHAISGSNLYKKNSFLLDSIGKVVFPDFINIHEQPHLLAALNSSSIDSEGVMTRNNRFVEKGVVCLYVLGSYSARKLGLTTTANSDGVHNLTIDPSASDLASLLGMMHTGLYVTELMGHGVNGLTGDYSLGASGFWVENGVIQYPVDEVTIASNLKDMFKGIRAVGNDINPNSGTRCGSVLIEEMMIAGH